MSDPMKPAPEKCTMPPAGWKCMRPKGHEGPCAAMLLPEDEGVAEVRSAMNSAVERVHRDRKLIQELSDERDLFAVELAKQAKDLIAAKKSAGEWEALAWQGERLMSRMIIALKFWRAIAILWFAISMGLVIMRFFR